MNRLLNAILSHGEKLRQKAKVSKKKLSSLKSYKAQATLREKKRIKKNKTKDNGITALWKSIVPENGGTLFKYNKAIREAILIIIEMEISNARFSSIREALDFYCIPTHISPFKSGSLNRKI